MWLRHSIEHLVCIGGELEHHQALSPSARKNRAVCSALARGAIYRHHYWSRLVAWTGTKDCSLVPVRGTNQDQWVAYIYPSPASRALSLLCFLWPARRELCGALAHLLCTRGVRWNARATLLKLYPLQARPPSSIFLNICLGLAVHHAPSPSSPPSIARADLVAGTTVVSLLFLSSLWKEKKILTCMFI